MNIPAEWRQLFDKAGVTEEELKDKNTAIFIINFVAASLRAQSGKGTSSANVNTYGKSYSDDLSHDKGCLGNNRIKLMVFRCVCAGEGRTREEGRRAAASAALANRATPAALTNHSRRAAPAPTLSRGLCAGGCVL
jgi:hypothetical protein